MNTAKGDRRIGQWQNKSVDFDSRHRGAGIAWRWEQAALAQANAILLELVDDERLQAA
jgi:hypothetical protein